MSEHTECLCGHVFDEHEDGEFCLVELDDGTHCRCLHYEGMS